MVSPLTMVRAAGVAAAFCLAMPVAAQSGSEEITVTGHNGRLPDSVQTVSQSVSYADLDLSTKSGKDELRHRLNLTARFLCEKLGETDTPDPVVPTCREAAVKDAMDRVGTIEAHFAPRGSAWVAPQAWAPPYPQDWSTRYP